MMTEKELTNPNEAIDSCIYEFKEKHRNEEEAVRIVFDKEYEGNEAKLLVRISVLNQLYSTRIEMKLSVTEMRKKLQGELLESLHRIGNQEQAIKWVVDTTNYIKNDAGYGPISFVSKYCSWFCITNNNNIQVPIVDRYSKGMLYRLNKKYKFYNQGNCTYNDLTDYVNFCSIYDAFAKTLKRKNNGSLYSYKEIDMYLWTYGRNHGISID